MQIARTDMSDTRLPAPSRLWGVAPLGAFLIASCTRWLDLFALWNETSTLGHGWLLLAVVAWIVWRRRSEIAQVVLGFWPAAAVVLGLLACVWAVAIRLEIATIELTLLPIMLLAGLAAATGRDGLRVLAFPVLLIMFATPVWFWLVPILQHATIVVVGFAVRAAGIVALLEGEFVTLPAGTLRIAEGCSGVHQFVVAALIGTLNAAWNFRSTRARIRVFLLACVTAILSNWVRVFLLVVIGYTTEMQHYFVRVDHYWFGWGIFAVAIAIYFAITRRVRDDAPGVAG
jgi:exosortase